MEENNTNPNVEVNASENKPVEAKKGCCDCKMCAKHPICKIVVPIIVIILVIYAITMLVSKNGPKEEAIPVGGETEVGTGSVTIEVLPPQGGTVTPSTEAPETGVSEPAGKPVLE
jgi:hypothetical protein